MRFILAAVLLLPILPLLADVVYTYDFQTLPEDWTADPEWSFGSGGAAVAVSASGGPPVSNYAMMESDSEPIMLPAGTDSVLIQVSQDHTLDGYFTTGEAYASVYGWAYHNGSSLTLFSFSQSWGFPYRSSRDTSSVSFPAEEGDYLAFKFSVYASAFGGSATSTLQIYYMTVTAYVNTAIENSTWADIKAAEYAKR